MSVKFSKLIAIEFMTAVIIGLRVGTTGRNILKGLQKKTPSRLYNKGVFAK